MHEINRIILIILLLPQVAIAGWFGPDDYDECVLEKMKGQSEEMLWTARSVCEKQFPYEKELHSYKDNIEIELSSMGSDLILSIRENHGDYIITRYTAQFSKKSCDQLTSNADYTLTKTFIFSPGDNVAVLSVKDADKYKCMRTDTILGRYRK